MFALLLAISLPARGHDLDAQERALRDAWAERTRLVDDRTKRMAEAAALADEIAKQKAGAGSGHRADRRLEDSLKRFDRVAGRLDALDRKIRDQDRSIAVLTRRFEDTAASETARLTASNQPKKAAHLARELDAIDQARRRVAALGAHEPVFRPVLEVGVSPEDGPVELQEKILLLETERDRVLKGMARVDADASVLAARIQAKRHLSQELESEGRTPDPEQALARSESKAVAQSLRDLSTQRDALLKQKADLVTALTQVDQRLAELRSALRSQDVSQGH
jgi:hypothetical protein